MFLDTPKPKRDFIKENAKRFKDPKKQSGDLDNHKNRLQNISGLSTVSEIAIYFVLYKESPETSV